MLVLPRLRATLFACLAACSIALLVPLTAGAATGPSSSYDPPNNNSPSYDPPNHNSLDTYITDGPSQYRFSMDRTPTFKFRSNNSNANFECRLDHGAWYSCYSPHTTYSLNDGYHDFYVRAKYGSSYDQSPAHRRFLIDHDFVPDTEITGGPGHGETIRDTTPTFTFKALNRSRFNDHYGRGTQYGSHSFGSHPDDHDSRFECRLDKGYWFSCRSPYTTQVLSDGVHTFAVRAIVQYRVDPTPATRTFTVDRGIPETTITGGPADGATTTDAKSVFSFESNRVGSTFACSVDGVAFACTSPLTTSALEDGNHVFTVAATSNGMTDPTPAKRTFRVDVPNAVTPPPLVLTPSSAGGSPSVVNHASKVTIASLAGRVGSNGMTKLMLRCSGGSSDCVGTLTVVKTIRVRCDDGFCFIRKTIARKPFDIDSGKSAAVWSRVTREGMRLVHRTSTDRLLVLATATCDANQTRRAVTLIG
jgi:hypothetical protein